MDSPGHPGPGVWSPGGAIVPAPEASRAGGGQLQGAHGLKSGAPSNDDSSEAEIRICSVRSLAETRKPEEGTRGDGGQRAVQMGWGGPRGGGLDGSESHFQATPRKLARKDLVRRTASRLFFWSLLLPSGCRVVANPVTGLCGHPCHSLFSPREPSPAPSGRPVTSTHAAQGADSGHVIQ